MNQELNILLIGNGSRESAIAWKIMQSPRCKQLFTVPAPLQGATHIEGLNPMDFGQMKDFVVNNNIDLVVVGPEVPLVAGIADELSDVVKVIGPDSECARLEGSKEFAKEFMYENSIPTARFMTVTSDTIDEGFSFLESLKAPYVLKADGLAAGKGVLIVETLNEAKESLKEMLEGMFGDASATVVIEEYLSGRECSVFVATDGEDYKILPPARDYKRHGVGDTGLNTGGMGALSPVSYATDEFLAKVEKRIIVPTLRGLKNAGMTYTGFIFLGLMEVDGEPMVIEYNVRLGDPETTVVLPRIESDIVDLFEGIADKTLAIKKLKISPESCAAVVVTSEGYPTKPITGREISGLMPGPAGAMHTEKHDSIVFPAGMKQVDGTYTTSGGRVATAVAMGMDIQEAVRKALATAEDIIFEGAYHRSDIGTGA